MQRRGPALPVRLLAPFAAASRSLVALFLAMLVLTLVALAGLALDPRLVTAAPAWLKPLKFALSTAIYALSFAWLVGRLEASPRVKRGLAGTTAAMLFLELGLIFLQAARATTSHFNLATPFDLRVFNAMGVAIAALWIVQLVTTVLLLRQRFEDPALGWALRLGMAVTALGAAVGWVMVAPSAAQLESLRHGLVLVSGAHTVGGPDGDPGLPLTNWSRLHGDLRAAHFVGLHALQAIPLFALALGRLPGLGRGVRTRLVLAAAASYAGLFALLLWQALRGEPIASPGAQTRAALAAWLLASLLALLCARLLPAQPATAPAAAEAR